MVRLVAVVAVLAAAAGCSSPNGASSAWAPDRPAAAVLLTRAVMTRTQDSRDATPLASPPPVDLTPPLAQPQEDPANPLIAEAVLACRESGKQLLLVISTKQCAPCEVLKNDLIPKLDLEVYHPLFVDATDLHKGKLVSEYFGATRFPYVVLGDKAGGKPVKQGLPPTESVSELQEWLKGR